MLNSTNKEELEERPFTREIYNYLRKVEKKKSKEIFKNESGHVFVAKCKTKCLSEPKPAHVKIFNEEIREILRNTNVNKTEDDYFKINTVYEINNEDLNQSILVESNLNENSEEFVKSNNEENPIADQSWNGMDVIMNSTYQINTHQNVVFENVNHFGRFLGPFPDEPLLTAFDKCMCLMLTSRQDQ